MMKSIQVSALAVLAIMALQSVGCESYWSTTPLEDEQAHFNETMEQVDAPDSLREQSDREVEQFNSEY